ncbi:hypothetical protein VC83_09341 [Pseudogymnoascus destructans]|uniref:Chromatin assembly factor 1 subunit A n=2 Tax=Pseudogymnoascus destructans TaxID=655981 RepID=L8FV80_PSED2|nr:uncharacterized protein VC83_09341 [Pseudogymnoascus destructans]ELR03626.1 hypothetical protein GMDG_06276 [Pseudogymnoascus destructans 20631-21]OAF54360.1 hypothetical protein VC83_09341 [Pseudogymnoascus destructans]
MDTSMGGTSVSPRSLKRQHEDSSTNVTSPPLKMSLEQRLRPCAAHHLIRESSPARSDTESVISEAPSRTPSLGANSPLLQPPNAFSMMSSGGQPPKRKPKLTFAEQEHKKILKEIRDREKADERARKEAEKRDKEHDKARRDAEKEAERQKKEAEKEEKRLIKEAEKLVKDAERAEKEKERKAKEEDKRKKEEEKQRLEEEKKKKERSQKKLNSFFISQPAKKAEKDVSPEPGNAAGTAPDDKSPNKRSEISDYDKVFPAFFVQNSVTLAPILRFERDEFATQILEHELDACLSGSKASERPPKLDATKAFNIPHNCFTRRGRRCVPVKQIMSHLLGGSSRPIDLTTDSQNAQIKNTRTSLRAISYKILKFAEDVRPPYIGTYTKQPVSGAARLARNPIKRDLPGVDYDYDSEAEWEEPGEDEEDLGSEGEDDDDADGEEDLDGFLDDADDEIANARKLVLLGDLEPKSTGLCWEDEQGRYPNIEMRGFALEVIHENIKVQTPIDPFATHYWAPPAPPPSMQPPRLPLNPMKGTSAHLNGPPTKTVKMFGLTAPSSTSKGSSSSSSGGKSGGAGTKKLVAPDEMPAFKQAVQGNELSKLGLIEVLNKQFPKSSKGCIKNTLEVFARREGGKEAEKRWVWREEGGVS